MPPRDDLTADEVRVYLTYIPEAGVFIWKKVGSNRVKVGSPAGCRTKNGYWHIGVKGKWAYAHRLAWLYVHGEWPDSLIDHIDGNRSNNRIGNLRKTDMAGNAINGKVRSTNKSGHQGVSWDKEKGKWVVMVSPEKYKRKLVGRFDRLEDAIKASEAARKELYGEFNRK